MVNKGISNTDQIPEYMQIAQIWFLFIIKLKS